MPRAGWVVVLCVLHLPAFAAELDAAGVVRSLYAHLSGGDVVRAAALWTEASRPQFERKYARIAAVRCMRVESLDLQASIDGDAATVDAAAAIAEWHALSSSERLARRSSRFRLRREGNAWRIEEWLEKEQQLADAIARAGTGAERDALLAANAALVGLELADALTKRGVTLINEVRYADAEAVNAIARRIAEDGMDERVLAKVTGVASVLARQQASPDLARSVALAEEGVRLAESSGDADTLMQSLLRLMRAQRTAHAERNIELYEPALALTDRVEDLSIAAHVATQAAWYSDDRGEHRKALTHSMLAEKFAKASGDRTALINALMNLAGTYYYRNDIAIAEAYYGRALALAREANFPETVASILERMASVAFNTRRPEVAMPLLEEMLKISSTLGSARIIAMGLILRANHRQSIGDLAGADADATRAVQVAEQSRDAIAIQDSRRTLAAVRYGQGRFEEVLVLTPYAELQAMAYTALGRHVEAEQQLRGAIDEYELRRREIGVDPRQMRQYMDVTTPPSNALVTLLVDCGRIDEAIEELERRKASVLRDVLAQAGAPDVSALDPTERNRLAELEAQLVQMNRAVLSRRTPAARQEVVTTRLDLARLWSRIYGAHPELVWISVPAAPIARLAPATGDVVYVSYLVTDEGVVVFTLSRNAHGHPVARTVKIAIGRDELRKRVRQFVRQIESRDLGFAANARALYDLVLRPIEAELFRDGRRICIIPDDELWRLPFHALKPSKTTFLAEKASVFYAPSISVVNELKTRDAGISRGAPRLLAFGNPSTQGAVEPLPHAESEARRIASLYPPSTRTVRLNGQADEGAFKADVAGYDVVHIAAHAQHDESPMYSAVLLSESASEDGRLEAREIASMKLGARLVVISACESARGDDATGEGVVGLPWALLATGARSSVVSLWPVDSTATAKLMEDFHRRLLAKGFASVSDALRDAQLALRTTDEYSHPYYWAPFIAVGSD